MGGGFKCRAATSQRVLGFPALDAPPACWGEVRGTDWAARLKKSMWGGATVFFQADEKRCCGVGVWGVGLGGCIGHPVAADRWSAAGDLWGGRGTIGQQPAPRAARRGRSGCCPPFGPAQGGLPPPQTATPRAVKADGVSPSPPVQDTRPAVPPPPARSRLQLSALIRPAALTAETHPARSARLTALPPSPPTSDLHSPCAPCATSTDSPSTESPSTDSPSTDSPSTDSPSTDSPSTDSPSTDSPSTDSTSTDSPSTDSPSTDSPSTDSPSTDSPSTDSPSTDSPYVPS